MKLSKKITVLLVSSLVLSSVFADEKGKEIMKRAEDKKSPSFTQSMVLMELKDKSGSTDTRQVVQYGKDDGKKTSVVMDFKGPSSVKDTRFLQITNDNAPDDKWIYLPALKSVRRVNSSEGSKSFMGTDATYDDLSSRKLEEDEHEFLREETYTVSNGTSYECNVVKNTPIDKKTDCPVHSEMYDKNGKLIKTLDVLKIENINGYDVPMENILKNVQNGHSTSLKILKIAVDKPIPERVFTQQFLSTGK